ncbi:MAG TPA: rhomboid family intramembrane serine protease, partial [Bacteroidia bacterium]|nr:rhomboid family intramembrane serine protease [Bacteroidia bacterium]
LHYFESSNFKVYQLVTNMFLHGSIMHIVFNMYGLWMFGQMIENYYGTRRFLIFYFVCGIGASIIQEASVYVYFHHIHQILDTYNASPSMADYATLMSRYFSDVHASFPPQTFDDTKAVLAQAYTYSVDHSIAIGASGAIFGVLVAFAIIFSEVALYILFIPIPVKAKYVVAGYAVYELYSGIANHPGDNVAHFAHLGGALFGAIMVLYWRRKR